MIKRLHLILLVLIFLSGISTAAEDGGLPGYFLNKGVGARAWAMGNSYTANSTDSTAFYWNPASLPIIGKSEISAAYLRLFEKTRYNYLSYAGALNSELYYALGFIQLASWDIEERDEYDNYLGDLTDYHNAYFASLAYPFKYGVYGGLSIKAVQQIIDDVNTTGYGADLSILCTMFDERLKLGCIGQNIISPNLTRTAGDYDLPFNLKTAVSYIPCKNLIVSMDADHNNDRSVKWHFGSEYKYKNISLRAGVDDTKPSAGLGFKFYDYAIDYAAVKNAELGYEHGLSMNYYIKDIKAPERSQKKIIKMTGLENNYKVEINTSKTIPCAIYDLLDAKDFSIVNLKIDNMTSEEALIKVVYKISGKTKEESRIYSIKPNTKNEFNIYPDLLPEVIGKLQVHTPALISVKTYLLAKDPKILYWLAEKNNKIILEPYDHYQIYKTDAENVEHDLLDTLASWVTFNDRTLSKLLSKATEKGAKLVPPVKIIGEQPPEIFTRIIEDTRSLAVKNKDCLKQIKLIYNVLKDDYRLTYMNQPIAYKEGQRVKYPANTLTEKGNCIELSVLFASILESIEMSPFILLMPNEGHAALGWVIEQGEKRKMHIIEPNAFGKDFKELLIKGDLLRNKYALENIFENGKLSFKNGVYRDPKGDVVIINIEDIRDSIPPSSYSQNH